MSDEEQSENFSNHKIIKNYEMVRKQLRRLYARTVSVENEMKDVGMVLKILQECNPGRQCYYFSSGFLMRVTVKDALHRLIIWRDKMEKEIEDIETERRILKERLKDFHENYDIRVQREVKLKNEFLDEKTWNMSAL